MSDGPPLLVAGPRRPASAQPALARLAIGVLLILIAVVLFAATRLVAGGQRHSYDPGATPPTSYRLTAGRTYQLSSPTGVASLQKDGVLTSLACSWSTDGELLNPLTIVTTLTDDRDLRTFATVIAPATGSLRIACNRIDKVFLDDADDSGPDTSALLLLITIAVGVLGVSAAVSGGYQLSAGQPNRPLDQQPAG
ncbi:MAG: hypothetical protein ACR2N4_11070 [Jatrophihabitans sp.]